VKTTPLQANLHLWSQKRRRSSFIPSRCLPACLAPIQRISLPQVKASMALKVALDTPYQSCNAPTSILQLGGYGIRRKAATVIPGRSGRLANQPPRAMGRQVTLCRAGARVAPRPVLAELGVPADRVHRELFYVEDVRPQQETHEEQPVTAGCEATIILDSRSTTVTIRPGTPVLDGAQLFRPDLPFACKGGVCGTCRAKALGLARSGCGVTSRWSRPNSARALCSPASRCRGPLS
jgi:hypothetical protein